MVYINPKKKFEGEHKISVKIQIDNSLRLGWKKEDILLVTNFPYEYNSVKAFVLEDDTYCSYFPRCSKAGTIIKLFEKHLINNDTLYWYHDLDAYQMVAIEESEIPEADMSLCDYGPGYNLWCGGNIFFRKNAEDIFVRIKEVMDSHYTLKHEVISDELALYWMRHQPDIKLRVHKLNISYSLHSRRLEYTYPAAIKPIRIVHCHFDHAGFFLYGKNRFLVQIAPDRVVQIFNNYGIGTTTSMFEVK